MSITAVSACDSEGVSSAVAFGSLVFANRASIMDFAAFSVVINLLVVITINIPVP